MNINAILPIICFLIIVITFVIIVFVYRYIQKYYKLVENNSEQIKELKKLNLEIKFNENLQTKYCFTTKCNSKRQLDNLSLQTYLITLIENNREYFSNIYDPIMNNIISFADYKKKFQKLKSTITNEICTNLKTNIKKF